VVALLLQLGQVRLVVFCYYLESAALGLRSHSAHTPFITLIPPAVPLSLRLAQAGLKSPRLRVHMGAIEGTRIRQRPLGQRRASDDSLRRAESEAAGDYNAAADLSCLGAAQWERAGGLAEPRHGDGMRRIAYLAVAIAIALLATSPCSASASRSCSRVC
jgi:hypothetical protein